jgi:hypothetical protein
MRLLTGSYRKATKVRLRSFRIVMPSFWLGSARTFDLAGNLNRYVLFRDPTATPAETDARAVASDWALVEDHIASALERVGFAKVKLVDQKLQEEATTAASPVG